MRRGYMGHLTRIANTVVHNLEKGPVHTQINYQIQQMTANFVDQFGFNDDEFTDHDDSIGATFDRIAEININIDTGHDTVSLGVCLMFLFLGSDWVADFGEVNSTAPAAGAALSPWDAPVSQPAAAEAKDKGWAKFTDFQPFCW
ncbi:hypothetical protein GOODEAATRI_006746 [Goodea atripinnis]|uniref:Uncharacterized protein n=1 Tax=Goodea atripinnis TaxID=208336 RepID=A0ABV0MZ98_9TELE